MHRHYRTPVKWSPQFDAGGKHDNHERHRRRLIIGGLARQSGRYYRHEYSRGMPIVFLQWIQTEIARISRLARPFIIAFRPPSKWQLKLPVLKWQHAAMARDRARSVAGRRHGARLGDEPDVAEAWRRSLIVWSGFASTIVKLYVPQNAEHAFSNLKFIHSRQW